MRKQALFGTALALILLAGCGSTNGIFGGSPTNSPMDIRGTVDSVDLNSMSILLTNVSGYNSMLSSSGGDTARIYFDSNTTVQYNGQNYRPQDLDRGDQVDVRADQNGNRLQAETMTVTYNARANGSSPSSTYPSNGYPSNGYPSSGSTSGVYNNQTLRGTVQYVDTSRRTITVTRAGRRNQNGQSVTVDYDPNMYITYNGRSYRPSDLQAGDQIEMTLIDNGSGRMMAQNINVLRSINGNGNTSSTQSTGTIRGTVNYVDASRRTITLDSTSWTTGFIGGSNTSGTMTIEYDANSQVNYNGQLYPVTNLQRGDVVDVQVQNLGNSNLFARTLTVVRDVNSR